ALGPVLAVDLHRDVGFLLRGRREGHHLVVYVTAQPGVGHHRIAPPDGAHDGEDRAEDEEEGAVAVSFAQRGCAAVRGLGRCVGTVDGVVFRGRWHRESPNEVVMLSKISPSCEPLYAART